MAFKKKVFHKEENCLNCNYPLIGDYCAKCGQKAFLHKDSFWHMVIHFAGDYFHYNNKFWTTFKTLFTKPGLATLEYIDGKRAKYLNPIPLYIFSTSIYFLLAFAGMGDLDSALSDEETEITTKDSTINSSADSLINDLKSNSKDSLSDSTNEKNTLSLGSKNFNFTYNEKTGFTTPDYKSLREYDSAQNLLPEKDKASMLERFIARKTFEVNEKYPDKSKIKDVYYDKLIKNVPKVFFVLLPFFAILLKLFFRKKKLYYVDHLIFSIHFHSFIFILLIIGELIAFLNLNEIITNSISLVFILGTLIYLGISFKKVYGDPVWKIVIKEIFISSIYFIGFIIVLLLLFVVAALLL